MSPAPRVAWLLGALALAALVVPPVLCALGVVALLAAVAADARVARRPPRFERELPRTLSRGVAASLAARPASPPSGRVRVRQPVPGDLLLSPSESDDRLEASVVARRRGRHVLPPLAVRSEGPLGLARFTHTLAEEREVLVYPDLPAAARVAGAVRAGALGDESRLPRGPIGLGTEFESIREYLADDDLRQVNWRATARLGRPMSNQYRVEQDREAVCLVDAGRLMAASVDERTRLDAAVDAATTVATVAGEQGDRVGAVAFDAEIRRRVAPGRGGSADVVGALFDLEPSARDSDYELAFRTIGGAKRSFVLVLTDLLDEAAGRSLLEAMPVIGRRHEVTVASATDPDLERLVATPPARPTDAYGAGVALEVLVARERVAALLRRAGAEVVEARPAALGAACVRAYLSAKARGRL